MKAEEDENSSERSLFCFGDEITESVWITHNCNQV